MINPLAYEKVMLNHPYLFYPNFRFSRIWLSGAGLPGVTYLPNESARWNFFSHTRWYISFPRLPVEIRCQVELPMSGCVGHGRAGTKGTYYQECPLDDFSPLLFIFTTGAAFLTLYKKPLRFKNEDIHHHGSL